MLKHLRHSGAADNPWRRWCERRRPRCPEYKYLHLHDVKQRTNSLIYTVFTNAHSQRSSIRNLRRGRRLDRWEHREGVVGARPSVCPGVGMFGRERTDVSIEVRKQLRKRRPLRYIRSRKPFTESPLRIDSLRERTPVRTVDLQNKWPQTTRS